MSVIIASILGFLTGGVATFLLLKLQTRKPAAPTEPRSPVTPATQAVPQPATLHPSEVPAKPASAASAPVADSSSTPVMAAAAPEPTVTAVAPPTVSAAPAAATDSGAAPIEPDDDAPGLEAFTRHYLDPDIELLSYRIGAWGNSGRAVYAPQLISYAQHPNHQIRKAVAIAFGKIATTGSLRSDEARSIQALGKLSRDAFAPVREAAVAALGQVKSAQVIPLLQQALRDADPDVVRLSSAALAHYKYYRVRPVAKPASAKKR